MNSCHQINDAEESSQENKKRLIDAMSYLSNNDVLKLYVL
jgi:hypothetical protein